MNSILKISVSISFLLVSLGIAYYYVIFIPGQVKQNKADLQTCLDDSMANYIYYWSNQCKQYEGKDDPKCSLPNDYAKPVSDSLKEDQNNCFRQYPQR